MFHVATSRSQSVLEEFAGTDFAGLFHCGNFSANCRFAWNFNIKGQYCWAHLNRDIRFLKVARRPPDSKEGSNLTNRFCVVELFDGSHYGMSLDYFRFMFVQSVEQTNSHSQHQLCHCVIDRRITQGTRSEAELRYHERMWTAIATCGKQQHDFFVCLIKSIAKNSMPNHSS